MTEGGFILAGYGSYDGVGGAGFLLPVFRSSRGRLFIQTDDLGGSDIELHPIDLPEDALGGGGTDQQSFDVYNKKFFAFRDFEGRTIIGTIKQIEPELRRFANNYPRCIAINMQIAELCGSPVERRAARDKMVEVVRLSSGTPPADYLRNSSISAMVFWRILLSVARDDESKEILISLRSPIVRNFSVELSYLLPIEEWRRILELINCNIIEAINIFQNEVNIPKVEQDDYENTIEFKAELKQAKYDILKIRDPHSRVIFILQLVMNSPKLARAFVREHEEPYAAATYLLSLLRPALGPRSFSGTSGAPIVADVIPKLTGPRAFRYSEAMLRDVMEKLGPDPIVSPSIRRQIAELRSIGESTYLLGIKAPASRALRGGTPAA